jgi:hypothetical protein
MECHKRQNRKEKYMLASTAQKFIEIY